MELDDIRHAGQHHERADGSGYPLGLRSDAIDPISRVCAVVDSFDAMTALRPFKRATLCVSDAIVALQSETPARYDAEVMAAWLALLKQVDDEDLLGSAASCRLAAGTERRRNKRYAARVAADAALLRRQADGKWHAGDSFAVTVHSVSRFGLGLLSPRYVRVGEHLRVHIAGTKRRPVGGVVVRCREYRDGWFEVGVELATEDASQN